MVIAVCVLLGLLWAFFRRRSITKDRRAGIVSTTPTYSLTPPTRYSTRTKDHRL